MNQCNALTQPLIGTTNWKKSQAIVGSALSGLLILLLLLTIMDGPSTAAQAAADVGAKTEAENRSNGAVSGNDGPNHSPETNTAVGVAGSPNPSPERNEIEQQGNDDGDLMVTETIYADEVRYPITSKLTVGELTVPVTTTGFAAGDEVLIINMQGDDSGRYETTFVSAVNAASLTLASPLKHIYDGSNDSIMVQRIPHYGQVTVGSGGELTAHAWDGKTGGVLFLRAANVTVQAGGAIAVNEKGYPAHNGPGDPIGDTGEGRHGGYTGSSGELPPYGNPYRPVHPGSGGRTIGTGSGGSGGGAIHLVVSNTVTLSGSISANGAVGVGGKFAGGSSGGGAGGSVWIETSVIKGDGVIQANGNDGGVFEVDGPGGAGGRIAIYAITDDLSPNGSLQAYGGSNAGGAGPSNVGGAGTIYLNDSHTLLVDNGGFDGSQAGLPAGTYDFDTIQLTGGGHLAVDGELLLTNQLVGDGSASLTGSGAMTMTAINQFQDVAIIAQSDLVVTNSLRVYTTTVDVQGVLKGAAAITLDDGGRLKLDAAAYPSGVFGLDRLQIRNGTLDLVSYDDGDDDYSDDYGFTLRANNMTVAEQGTISADGTGYGPDRGPGTPGTDPTFGVYQSGAGHGGQGGQGENSSFPGGPTYGDLEVPITLGSGGGGSGGSLGGGALHLVADTLWLDGSVTADAITTGSSDAWYGGASGGSVWVETAVISGSGVIRANGGDAIFAAGNGGGGGGGGYIALYTVQDEFTSSGFLTVNGGTGYENGQPGQIHVGNLIPIAGLTAGNDSPSVLGQPTIFSATVTTGDNVSYAWAFGDGRFGNGRVVTHTYADAGTYTAVVTASNLYGAVTATTAAVINDASPTVDLVVTKSGPSEIPAGSVIVYPITVANQGQAPATQVVITDTLPLSTTFVAQTSPYSVAVDAATGSVTWGIDFLAAGVTETFALQAQVAADAVVGAPLINTITGAIAETDADPRNNRASQTTTVSAPPPGPDLVVTKSGPAQRPAGFPITYDLTVANQGGETAVAVVLTDTLPAVMSFLGSSHPDYNTSYDASTNTVVWQVGSLAPGESRHISLQALVTETAPAARVTNSVEGTFLNGEDDVDPATNQASHSTRILAPAPRLKVRPATGGNQSDAAVLPVLNGNTAAIVITVTNTGTGVLTGGLSLTGIDYPWLSALQPATTTDLAVGQSVTFTLQVADAGQELGDYYDLLLIESPNDPRLGTQPFYLKVYVHPPLATFTVPVTNTLGEPVPGAQVAFTKAVTRRVLVDGQPGPGNLSRYFKDTDTADGSGLARLPQMEVGPYQYTISAEGHRTLTGTADISADLSHGRFVPPPLLALPGLVFEPSQTTVSAVAGQATAFSFRVSNEGPADAHDFRVQTPRDLPWISGALPSGLTTLPAGQAMAVTLFFNPPPAAANSIVDVDVVIGADDIDPATLTARVHVLTDTVGSLAFNVTDQAGNPIQDARIVVTNQNGRTANTPNGPQTVYDTQTVTTDGRGEATATDLPPARYNYVIEAENHYMETGSADVSPGSPAQGQNNNRVTAQLETDPFAYTWTVQETTIRDTYAITVAITVEAGAVEPLLYVSHAAFCPGDEVEFIVANVGPVTMTNVLLTPNHSGVSFAPIPPTQFQIGELAPGQAVVGRLATSGAGEAATSGRFRVSAQYRTQAGIFDYTTSNRTVKHCPAAGGGGGWEWHWIAGRIVGQYSGSSPIFPGSQKPPTPGNGREVARLILSGDATLERQAFNARLELNSMSGSAVEDISVNIEARDAEGRLVGGGFAITPTLPTLLGDLPPDGDVAGQWLILPGSLGITDTNGAIYTLVAEMTYTWNGDVYTTRTVPQPITVYPQPTVRLNFSHSQPDENGDFYVAVSARNDGYGPARSLILDLSQVTTLGDLDGNGRSLLFELKETRVDSQTQPLQYVFDYGDLQPGQRKTGRWLIHISADDAALLQEIVVTGFEVDCQHRPYQGLALSDLLDCGEIDQIFLSTNCQPFYCIVDKNAVAGASVNTANGNYSYRQSTPSIPAVGSPLQFSWTYNSLNSGAGPDLPAAGNELGPGWGHNYDVHLETGQSDRMVLRGPDGGPVVFRRGGAGYQPAPGVLAHLEEGQSDAGQTVYTVTAHTQATYVLSDTGRLLRQTDPQGNALEFAYDGGHLARVLEPVSGHFLDFDYDDNGRLASVTDPANRITRFGYDSLGHLTAVTDTRDAVWRYQYTELSGGQRVLAHVIDPDGRSVEQTGFDDQGRAISQTVKGHTFTVDYYQDGRRTVTDGLGRTAIHAYNAQGLLVAARDALGGIERFVLDSYTNRISSQDKRGHTSSGQRTPFGYTTVLTDALGQATRYAYDQGNNRTRTVDALGRTTTTAYDSQNNPITETNALGQSTIYDYDQHGQLTRKTDANGTTTAYGYDTPSTGSGQALGQRTVMTDAAGLVTRYEYDAVGRLITTTDSSGKVTVNIYDDGDRLVQVTSNAWPGRPQNYRDQYNLVTRYGYDRAGHQTTVTNTLGQVNLTLYDEFGRVVTRVTNYDGVTPINQLCTDFSRPHPELNVCSLTEYNQMGQVAATVDSLGRRNVTEYDELGRVVRTVSNWHDGVFDPDQPDRDVETRTQYDAVGNTILVTDTQGHVTRHFYDKLNRAVATVVNWSGTITDVEGLAGCFSLPRQRDYDICTLYEFDEVGNTIIVTDTLGRVTRTYYDDLNRVVATVNNWSPDTLQSPADCTLSPDNESDENVCSLTGYDDAGNQITSTNALNQTSLTVYDAANRPLIEVANWDGTTPIESEADCSFPPIQSDSNLCSVTSYDALGQRSSVKDPMGNVTEFAYDSLGRVVTTTRSLDGVPVQTVTTYDPLGNRRSHTDAEGNTTTYHYDSLNRLQTTISAEGVAVTQTYNAAGWVLTTTNSLGHRTATGYDQLGRPVVTIDGENNRTQTRYDALGNRIAVTDANGIVTRYLYDGLNRRTAVIQNWDGVTSSPCGSLTSSPDTNVCTRTVYDALGNAVAVINAKDITSTVTAYDALNRPILVTDALGHQTHNGYDALGNRTVLTDGNGAVTTYGYDGLNRLAAIDYAKDGVSVEYSYDAVGNRTVMTDSLGTTRSVYDDLYRLTAVTDTLGAVVRASYDRVGNRTHLTYPPSAGSGQAGGQVVTYTYDGDNRLQSITDWQGGRVTYQYDAAGRLITMTLPNGLSTVGGYDATDRLVHLRHTSAGGMLLGRYDYALDGAGHTETVTETLLAPGLVDVRQRFLERGGLLVMEAENGTTTAGPSHAWQEQTVQAGSGGDGYLRALPDTGVLYGDDDTSGSPRLSFPVQVSTPATYSLWLRGMAPDAGSDSVHVGVEGQVVETAANVTGFAPRQWDWAGTTMSDTQARLPLTAAGTYTIDLRMREDGLRLDRLLLITDTSHVPSGLGPAESVRQTVTDTVAPALSTHVVDYDYDGLYRLTEAAYTGDITATYEYAYDTAGNRTAYTASLTSTVVTTYSYNTANQLVTARASDSDQTWHYQYDGNGNRLRQVPGGLDAAAGEVRYGFDQANRLVQIERHDGSAYQLQAEVAYDGRGRRVRTVATVAGTAVTTTYTLDGGEGVPLVVRSGAETRLLLIGREALGEFVPAGPPDQGWRYTLHDAGGSVRQLVDGNGRVRLARTYAPFGQVLRQAGDGASLYGYGGAQAGTAGLWYLEGGYFDPGTGRFLSGGDNPLAPLAAAAMANPTGLLLAPLLALHWWRRRRRKRDLVVTAVLLFGILLAMGFEYEGADPPPALPGPPETAPGGGLPGGGPPSQPTSAPPAAPGQTAGVPLDPADCLTPMMEHNTTTSIPNTGSMPASSFPPLPSEPPTGVRDGPPENPGGQQAYNAFVKLQEEVEDTWWGDEIDAQEAMVMFLNHEFGNLRNLGGPNRFPPVVIETVTRKYNHYCSAGPWSAECLNGFWAYSEAITNAEHSEAQRINLRDNARYSYQGFKEELMSKSAEIMNNRGAGGQGPNEPSDWFTTNNATPFSRQRYWDSIKAYGTGPEPPKEVYWSWPQPSNPGEPVPIELFLVFTRDQYPGTIRS